MTRSERIKRIVNLADTAKRSASQQLAASRRARDDNNEKLLQFQRYRDEYVAALNAPGASMSAARARELRQFIAQVEQVITALESVSVRSASEYLAAVTKWNEESRRARALGEVHERACRNEAHDLEAVEQREVDERYGNGVRRA
jgi:flagellar export protein FliJ